MDPVWTASNPKAYKVLALLLSVVSVKEIVLDLMKDVILLIASLIY